MEVRIDHESEQDQAGQIRQVKASIKAVAFGVMADRLRAVDLGQTIEITGFLANSKNGKVPVLHMQDFSVVQIIS